MPIPGSSSKSLPLGQDNTSNARGMPGVCPGGGGGCLSFDLTGTLQFKNGMVEFFFETSNFNRHGKTQLSTKV